MINLEYLQRLLAENKDLKLQIEILEAILRNYLPIIEEKE